MIDNRTVDGLLEEAYHLIRLGRSEEAVAVGQELLKHRHIRGFEIIALAFQQLDRFDDAIQVLSDALSGVPTSWPLWELLGNVYSDKDQYAEARNCYDRALACPNSDISSINYNFAVLLKRQGEWQEAMNVCQFITNPDMQTKLRVLQLCLLNGLHRYQEVMDAAPALIAELAARQDIGEEDGEDVARMYAELGRAQWESTKDLQTSWQNAWLALEWDRSCNSALWLVREIVNHKSPQSKWFRLIIEGRWHSPVQANAAAPWFATSYEVVADSVEAAFKFAGDLEPLEVRETLRLESSEELGPYAQHNQGVYWRAGYRFFD
jgi:tetratricopeptide (TPR) repeat protein